MSDEEVVFVEEAELEEGEITEDSDDSDLKEMTNANSKKLPKHYSLHDKKLPHEKHKKDCKHSQKHSNYKVKDSNKPSLSNVTQKKHKSSCSLKHQDYLKDTAPFKKNLTPPSYTEFSNNHDSSKSAFKNYSSPPRTAKTTEKSRQDPFDYSKLLLDYKKVKEQIKQRNKSAPVYEQKKYSLPKKSKKHSSNKHKHNSPKEKPSPIKNNTKLTINKDNNNTAAKEHIPAIKETQDQNMQETYTLIEEITIPDTDSEDEEELRKLALATCAQKGLVEENSANNEISSDVSPIHSLSNQSPPYEMHVENSYSDNYDVVDMDLDEENFVEDTHDNLFIIDNKPDMISEFNPYEPYMFADLNRDSSVSHITRQIGESFGSHIPLQTESYFDNHIPPQTEESTSHIDIPSENSFTTDYTYPPSLSKINEDIEEAILRAEVIASMYKNKVSILPIEEHQEPENLKESSSPQPQVSINKIPVLCNGHLQEPAEENKMQVVKFGNSKVTNTKTIISDKPINIILPQNRFIINLNNDSSEESDDADSKEEDIANTLDALISNARKESDMKADFKTNEADMNHVSCLSKTDQEKYKKYRNIIEKKETKAILPTIVVKEKISSEHQNLNFLDKKIRLAKGKLDREQKSFLNTEKEVIFTKKIYLSAKLKYQHLQEQLHAAKLIKIGKLKEWKEKEAKLVNAKNVVAKQKALIVLLETEFNNRRLQLEQNSCSPPT